MKSPRRLPAEWEPQSGVMLTWPHANSDWGNHLPEVEQVFAELCACISNYEKVLIIASDSVHRVHIENFLSLQKCLTKNIIFAFANSDDCWARDHGPINVIADGKLLVLDFQFNAWGNKYFSERDNAINNEISRQSIFTAPSKTINFILEGGSIESDGHGTLLTTDCLFSSDRNTGLGKQDIELELTQQLGVKQIHWLHHGKLIGDDTDAHIDTLARFVSLDKIAYVKCNDKADLHYDSLHAMEQELQQLRTLNNQHYELIPLPLPDAIFNANKKRLPASYANFLIINHCVLIPTYDQPKDQQAIKILQENFPLHNITPINCLPLIEQFGSLHCVTMQLPENLLATN